MNVKEINKKKELTHKQQFNRNKTNKKMITG
jgi:hypothetical protein